MSAQTRQASESAVTSEPVSGTIAKDSRAIYTMTAREGLDASVIVDAAFAKRTFGRETPRRLQVVAPDGPSTSGGKRARQTIRLVALAGEAAPVMIGYLDAGQRLVELRSYVSVRAQHEERFGHAIELSGDEYTKLCKDLQATLAAFRYTFAVETPAATDTRAQLAREESLTPTTRSAPLLNVILLSAVAVLSAGVALAMIMR